MKKKAAHSKPKPKSKSLKDGTQTAIAIIVTSVTVLLVAGYGIYMRVSNSPVEPPSSVNVENYEQNAMMQK